MFGSLINNPEKLTSKIIPYGRDGQKTGLKGQKYLKRWEGGGDGRDGNNGNNGNNGSDGSFGSDGEEKGTGKVSRLSLFEIRSNITSQYMCK